MTHFDLDLTQSHFVKTRGDLTLYASWYGERLRPCLVVLPTFGHAGTAGVPWLSSWILHSAGTLMTPT